MVSYRCASSYFCLQPLNDQRIRKKKKKQKLCRRKLCGVLTLNLSLWSFDVGQHAGHIDAVSVQILQEDVSIPPG